MRKYLLCACVEAYLHLEDAHRCAFTQRMGHYRPNFIAKGDNMTTRDVADPHVLG